MKEEAAWAALGASHLVPKMSLRGGHQGTLGVQVHPGGPAADCMRHPDISMIVRGWALQLAQRLCLLLAQTKVTKKYIP